MGKVRKKDRNGQWGTQSSNLTLNAILGNDDKHNTIYTFSQYLILLLLKEYTNNQISTKAANQYILLVTHSISNTHTLHRHIKNNYHMSKVILLPRGLSTYTNLTTTLLFTFELPHTSLTSYKGSH